MKQLSNLLHNDKYSIEILQRRSFLIYLAARKNYSIYNNRYNNRSKNLQIVAAKISKDMRKLMNVED